MFLLSQLLTHRYKVHSRREKRDTLLPSSSLLATKCHSIFFRYKLKESAVVIYRVYKRVVMSVKFMVANAPWQPRELETVRSRAMPPHVFRGLSLWLSLSLFLFLVPNALVLYFFAIALWRSNKWQQVFLSWQTNSILCRDPRERESSSQFHSWNSIIMETAFSSLFFLALQLWLLFI